MQYIVTPEGLKDWIDSMVQKGAKAFVVSTSKDGLATIPSKRVHLYRIPCSIHESMFRSEERRVGKECRL